MRIPTPRPARAVALGAAVPGLLLGFLLGFLLGTATAASADTPPGGPTVVMTKSGQKLSIEVGGELVGGRAVARGTATVSAGPTTIDSVVVSFDEHEDINVGVDARGRFVVDAPGEGASPVSIRATVTASDGTTATALAQGRIAKPAPRRMHHRHLADTGAPGPAILGPIGLVMLISGLLLVRWSSRSGTAAGSV